MARVFISFVHEDKSVAQAVQSLITQELKLGKDVFLSADQSQVIAGDVWLDKIRAALERCEVLVLMLSHRSLRRAWVNFEAGAVWLSKRPVIPVCFGNVSKEALPQPYSGMQAVNIPADAHYLLMSVHEHLKLTTPAPQSPVMRALFKIAQAKDEKSKTPLGRLNDFLEPYNMLDSALTSWSDEIPRRKLPPETNA